MLDMEVDSHDAGFGMTMLKSAAGEIRIPRIDAAPGASIRLRVRARDVMIATEEPRGLSALNILPGRISLIAGSEEPLVEIHIDCNGQAILSRITRQSLQMLGLAVGDRVFAVIKSVAFDRENFSNSADRRVPPSGRER